MTLPNDSRKCCNSKARKNEVRRRDRNRRRRRRRMASMIASAAVATAVVFVALVFVAACNDSAVMAAATGTSSSSGTPASPSSFVDPKMIDSNNNFQRRRQEELMLHVIRAGANNNVDGGENNEDPEENLVPEDFGDDEDTWTTRPSSSSSSSSSASTAVEEYVAAMKEKDLQGSSRSSSSSSSSSSSEVVDDEEDGNVDNDDDNTAPSDDNNNGGSSGGSDSSVGGNDDADEEEDSVVGVKSHHGSNSHGKNSNKKSNAVGDPDGDDDDDDDEDDDELSDEELLSEGEDNNIEIELEQEELSEDWEDMDEMLVSSGDLVAGPQVQVEVDILEKEQLADDDDTHGQGNDEDGGGDGDDYNDIDEEDGEGTVPTTTATTKGGGGVGLRLNRVGGGGGRRRNRNNRRKDASWKSSATVSTGASLSQDQSRLIEAWMPHVYFPPTKSALTYLADNARMMDASSKNRLDRRTLYAALLMEWGIVTDAKVTKTQTRKFLPSSTSQALQAALSLATQPKWRKSAPRTSGIRLYQDEDTTKGCTLGMQETVAMALAHSLGCGMLILDDGVINKVRHHMVACGLSDDAIKPAALIHSLLTMAKQGKLKADTDAGSISSCMKRDLLLGLDDPYDDRASISCDEMIIWEDEWKQSNNSDEKKKTATTTSSDEEKALPLLIFIRTNTSTNLLKSKSAMELLIQESTSNDSIHLVALGRGIDATTASLPKDRFLEPPKQLQDQSSQNMQGGNSPWFGFSPQNQNASGQNDPEGSRRFNIFLIRTIDQNGQPGILGSIAPPQAGNLFPHMIAMQARERLQTQEEDSPARAELERWAQMLQQHMDNNGSNGRPMPPPQFFNASLAYTGPTGDDQTPPPPPPPEVIEQVLQQAMSELLDRLAQMSDDGDGAQPDLPPDLQRAFAQVLRNDNLRRGIAENLARAAPALSDPKCQGVMLSVYVPPPPDHLNRGKLPGQPGAMGQQQNNMGGWFQHFLKNQDESSAEGMDEESEQKNKQKRVRTMAAAAAVMAANKANASKNAEKASENKAGRNLAKLETICRPIPIDTPQDPVRGKSWDSWISRERGAVIFRQNRKVLNEQLASRKLALQQHTGTRGAGSALRQMLSVRDISSDMEDVIKCAVELEAAKSQRMGETSQEMHDKEMDLDVDISLSQLVVGDDGSLESTDEAVDSISVTSVAAEGTRSNEKPGLQYIHPSSLETALTMKCKLSPSPSGAGLSVASSSTSHRSKDEIMALAQDKHERALVSQVVSPQDIGVTWDMVGGLSNVKDLLRQSITYPLKFPHLYSEGIAREAVKGVLLFGPPGTGKTLLAKAVATEGGASFLSVDASSVENKWLGESEKNAKAVFTLARRLAPCVIFIDEVDSLLSSREGSSDDSAHGTLTSVKTTMMSEWDGLNSGTNGSGDRVVVIGSTNRPFDLDEAVLRRFPRRILVDLPDLETRKEILEVTLAENRLDAAVNLTKIAERLDGYTGSDIKEVCREAVVQISHEQARLLDQGFENAGREDITEGSLQRLRPVTSDDFEKALSKLKRSVSEKGRELARVWEWNDEYGEIKKEKSNRLSHLMNMYL